MRRFGTALFLKKLKNNKKRPPDCFNPRLWCSMIRILNTSHLLSRNGGNSFCGEYQSEGLSDKSYSTVKYWIVIGGWYSGVLRILGGAAVLRKMSYSIPLKSIIACRLQSITLSGNLTYFSEMCCCFTMDHERSQPT